MNREKWYFIRDFIKEFFLVILKILAVIAIFAGVAFVFYSCIIQPWYLLVVAGFIVVFCIGKYAYKENPNDYERPAPFNYQAFINGEDVGEEGVYDGSSPSTGDTTSALVLVLFMFVISAATLVFTKRKEEM